MRIRDRSSDVCSSDLGGLGLHALVLPGLLARLQILLDAETPGLVAAVLGRGLRRAGLKNRRTGRRRADTINRGHGCRSRPDANAFLARAGQGCRSTDTGSPEITGQDRKSVV